MYKYAKKIIKYAKKKIAPDKAHVVEMALTGACGRTTITEIGLEFVNYCNLRCKWCPLDHAQKKSAMSAKVLRKFFDNLVSDRRFRGVEQINLFNGGEVLLHPDIIGMLKIVKEYKDVFRKRRWSFPKIDFLTNGTLLNVGLARQIVDLDVLYNIRFSVDGGSAEKYEELRRPARWDVISRNIKDFVKINNGKIKTGIICIVELGRPKDTGWMTGEFRDLCLLVDYLEIRHPHDWMGDVKVEGLKKPFVNYCKLLFRYMVILPNGDVIACCHDINGKKGVIGNILKEDLFSIYSCKARRQMRYDLLRGRRDRIELCRSCSGYS